MRSILGALVLSAAIAAAAQAHETGCDIELFDEEHRFSARDPAWDYEAIALDELVQLTPQDGEGRPLDRKPYMLWPYERRWGCRLTALMLAYSRASMERRPYLRHAAELAFWMVKHSDLVPGLPAEDLPATLEPRQVRDVLALDRSFRDAEDALPLASGDDDGR